jgi:hypothetical protein
VLKVQPEADTRAEAVWSQPPSITTLGSLLNDERVTGNRELSIIFKPFIILQSTIDVVDLP